MNKYFFFLPVLTGTPNGMGIYRIAGGKIAEARFTEDLPERYT